MGWMIYIGPDTWPKKIEDFLTIINTKIMALTSFLEQANAKIDALNAAIEAEKGQVAAALADLAAEIEALKELLGGDDNPALASLLARIDEKVAKVAAIYEPEPEELPDGDGD
jgi:ABC-type transporter Mla subunit MlaD